MTLVRWNPTQNRSSWNSLVNFQNRMSTIFDDHAHNVDNSPTASYIPKVDLIDLEDKFILEFELPGLKKEDVKIELHEQKLTVSGEKSAGGERDNLKFHLAERTFGSFSRSFQLPRTVELEKIEAHFKDGVLKMELPKKELEKPKQIDIHIE